MNVVNIFMECHLKSNPRFVFLFLERFIKQLELKVVIIFKENTSSENEVNEGFGLDFLVSIAII